MMVTRSDLPVNSVRDAIDLAKRNPGKLNVGTAGIGSPAHLSGALFASTAGVNLVFVPYKGAPAALTDLLGGQLDFYFATIPTALPHVKSGKLRALAMTSAKRSTVLPDVPTLAEAGVPGYDFSAWFGIIAPAKTPSEVIARLNAEIARAMQAPDVRDKLAAQGVEPTVSTSADFARQIEQEYKHGAEFAKAANLKPE
jgi:tripartite-type tricarboxylate transporter receptor subunit TctC